jgi:hypothetical protein
VGDIAGGRPHTRLAQSGHSHEIGMVARCDGVDDE